MAKEKSKLQAAVDGQQLLAQKGFRHDPSSRAVMAAEVPKASGQLGTVVSMHGTA